MNGLTDAQVKASLSAAGLTSAQRKQVLSALAVTTATKELTAGQVQERIASELNSEEDAKALIIKSGLISATELEENATVKVTVAEIEKAVANNVLSTSDAKVILGALGITSANSKEAVSFNILTKAIWANIAAMAKWLVTNPVGWAVIAVGAIAGVIKVIDHFTVSTKEALESLDETSTTFNETVSELKNLNSELETTTKRIDELEKLKDAGNITIAETEELDKLKKYNDELDRQIVLLNEKKIKDAEAVLRDQSNSNAGKVQSKYDTETVRGSEIGNYVSVTEEANNALEDQNELQEKKNKLLLEEKELRNKKETGDWTTEDTYKWETKNGRKVKVAIESDQTKLNKLSEQIQNIDDEIVNTDTYISELYNDAAQKKLAAYEDLIEAGIILEGTNKEEYDALIGLRDLYYMQIYTLRQAEEAYKALNAEQQKKVITDKLIANGLPTDYANAIVDSIPEIDLDNYYPEFDFVMPNIDDYKGDVRKFAKDFINLWKNSIKEASGGQFSDIFALENASGNATELGKAKEKVDELKEAYSGLYEIMKSYNKSGKFSVDQVEQIISYGGEYLKYLVNEDGQLELNKEALDNVAVARLNEMRIKALSELYNNLDNIKNEEDALKYLETQIYETGDAYVNLAYKKVRSWSIEASKSGKFTEETINKISESFKNQAKAINELFDNIDITSLYKSAEDVSSETKEIINSYMEYQKQSLETSRIDYKTYSDEVSKYLKQMFDAGKITAKEYHDYVGQMLEVQKSAYDKALSAVQDLFDEEIEKIEKANEAIEKQNEALEKQKTQMENAAQAVIDYYQDIVDELEKANEKLEEETSDMEKAISAVETYYDSLIEKHQEEIDLSNEQIEKYESLINVADKLYEEEQERLQDEQDAIQDKIDLLNEENDAKDLQYRKEQALYALQKAQQQRTKKIYTDGKGYIYEVDRDAVSSAQSDLQDIQTEELIKSLEDEKEALQESIDALQEYRDALSEVSDVYNEFVDNRNAQELLGDNYKDIILNSSIEDIEKLKDAYLNSNIEVEENEDIIERLEKEKEQWSSLTQTIEDENNKKIAIQQFGADWEIQINEGRFAAFEDFKNRYIEVQNQINDNTQLIESNNEKIEQWGKLSDSLNEQTNRQAAIQQFGADWEKQINDGRLVSFDEFKNKYLSINAQINDNTLLIESNQKKIDEYNKLKEKWSDVTSEYEKQVNKQYAVMLLGADWETKVLSGREDELLNFKNSYIQIQQAIADAAWNSANEQIRAAKEAAKAANGSEGASGKVGDYDNNKKVKPTYTYEVYDSVTGETVSGGRTEKEALEELIKIEEGDVGRYYIKTKAYAKGTEHAKKGLNLVGEAGMETFIDNDGNVSLVTKPSLIPMEGGEVVKNNKDTLDMFNNMNLVPIKNDLWKGLNIGKDDLSDMFRLNAPNLISRAKSFSNNSQNIEQHNVFNVTLPNITDSSKATQLFKELQRLPLDALQYSSRR